MSCRLTKYIPKSLRNWSESLTITEQRLYLLKNTMSFRVICQSWVLVSDSPLVVSYFVLIVQVFAFIEFYSSSNFDFFLYIDFIGLFFFTLTLHVFLSFWSFLLFSLNIFFCSRWRIEMVVLSKSSFCFQHFRLA